MPLSLFLVGRLLLGMQPILKSISFPQKDSLGENQISFCKQLSIRDNFWPGAGDMCPLPSALAPYQVEALCILPQSLN